VGNREKECKGGGHDEEIVNADSDLDRTLMVLPFPAQGQAGSPWFNPAWAYRNPTTINNPGGVSLSNFQAHVLLDSSFDFTKAKSDGSDIRFTASDGITLIPFGSRVGMRPRHQPAFGCKCLDT